MSLLHSSFDLNPLRVPQSPLQREDSLARMGLRHGWHLYSIISRPQSVWQLAVWHAPCIVTSCEPTLADGGETFRSGPCCRPEFAMRSSTM